MFQQLRYAVLLLILFSGLALVIGCGGGGSGSGSGSGVQTGVFLDSPVSGLTYSTPTLTGQTDLGIFHYHPYEIVTFSIGSLALGSATGASTLTPISILGAANASDQRVVNMCILLQTLDQDGDLNNGIQITPAIAAIVSGAGTINFNQTAAAFAANSNVVALLAALNAASPAVFSDISQRGARTLRSAADASAHFAHSVSPRITVQTEYGALRGFAPNASTYQWLGVPYAQPPIGNLRWRPPQDLAAWTGVREAIEWGDQAAQPLAYTNPVLGGMGRVSEDCLYLNIIAPISASNLPVMVWFHGGGFAILTGNNPTYTNPAGLTTKEVVVVTVNHRLGQFGYLAHVLLTAESGYGGSGNYGQMDQIAALTWVKNNIANFGGNPNNVTIFGESGGGGKVNSLMASPLATGLFHKAICESGMFPSTAPFVTLNTPPLATAEFFGATLFTTLGVTTLAQARAVPWLTIATSDLAHYGGNALFLPYGPNQDGYYATMNTEDSIKAGLPSDVPFLAGANAGDMTGLTPGLVEQMPWRYTYNSAPQYVYKFSKVPEGWRAQGVLAYHSDEITYVFNYPMAVVGDYYLGLVPLTITPALPANIWASAGWGPSDDTVADKAMTIWTNFAKTGNPSITGFTWPAYTGAPSTGGNDTYVEIGTSVDNSTALTVQTGSKGLSHATDVWP